MNGTVLKPWGSYKILNTTENYQVKELTIIPMQKFSYQYHHHRNEHWFIVKGEGIAIIDDKLIKVKEGDHIDIPALTKHRLINTHISTPLVMCEIQTGESFDENDIVRLKDDYGRC